MKFSNNYILRSCWLLGLGLFFIMLLPLTVGASPANQTNSPTLLKPLAAKSLILDLATFDQRCVAVGWRGHILLSDNDGQTWQQVEVPTRSMLTGVYFADNLRGWAVGHNAVILATEDGGKNWDILSAAPEEERPLFDLVVTGNYGFAIGAYAKFMVTQDGGKSWQAGDFVIKQSPEKPEENLDEEEPLPFDYHFYSITRATDKVFYIAAEAGYLFRSDDGGHTWQELPSPYEGSFFGILPLPDNALLAYGLRGHIFRSADGGQNWQPIETGTTSIITDAIRLPDGTVVVVGMGGVVLVSSDEGQTFTLQKFGRIGLTAIVTTASGKIVVAGERGGKILDLSSFTKTKQ